MKFFISKYERHILINKEVIKNYTEVEMFDLLLDFGFRTKLELVRFEHDQNLVEFSQDLDYGENLEQDFKISGEDLTH